MASSYGSNMYTFYTTVNNRRIQVIVHRPDNFHQYPNDIVDKASIKDKLAYVKVQLFEFIDNFVNDYRLPTSVYDVRKESPLMNIINQLLLEIDSEQNEINNKNLKKYWDVESQEEIYEIISQK